MIVVIAIVGITSISAQTTHELFGMRLGDDKKYDLEGSVKFDNNSITIEYEDHELIITLKELTDRWEKPHSSGGISEYIEYTVRVVSSRHEDSNVIVTNELCNVAIHNRTTIQILLRGSMASKEDNVEFLLDAQSLDAPNKSRQKFKSNEQL